MQEDFDFEVACRHALNEFHIETADGRTRILYYTSMRKTISTFYPKP